MTYWRYAVENIARGAVGWHEYYVTVSNDGAGEAHHFPLTLTPMLSTAWFVQFAWQQTSTYAIFVTNVFVFWILSTFHGHFQSPSFSLRTSDTILCFTLVNRWKVVAHPNVPTMQIQALAILLSLEGNHRTRVLYCFRIYITKRPNELLQTICSSLLLLMSCLLFFAICVVCCALSDNDYLAVISARK
jgi:hypothetical protein